MSPNQAAPLDLAHPFPSPCGGGQVRVQPALLPFRGRSGGVPARPSPCGGRSGEGPARPFPCGDPGGGPVHPIPSPFGGGQVRVHRVQFPPPSRGARWGVHRFRSTTSNSLPMWGEVRWGSSPSLPPWGRLGEGPASLFLIEFPRAPVASAPRPEIQDRSSLNF